MSSKTVSEGTSVDLSDCGNNLKFHHVHLYVDKLDNLESYKVLEDRLNLFGTIASTSIRGDRNSEENIEKARKMWKELGGNPPTKARGAAGRDVVRQLLVGPGFRITGSAVSKTTRSFRLTSRDGTGTKIIVTAPLSGGLEGLNGASEGDVVYPHLSLSPMFRAVTSQKTKTRRPSIAVLSFRVDSLSSLKRIRDNYAKFHPSLLCDTEISYFAKEKTSMLEVFAYVIFHHLYRSLSSFSNATIAGTIKETSENQNKIKVLSFDSFAETVDYLVLSMSKPSSTTRKMRYRYTAIIGSATSCRGLDFSRH